MTKFLPLGSVVLLKGGTQKLVIVARGLTLKNNEKLFFFEYGGVLYPDGLINDQLAYFNHDNISKVIFEGFSDVDDENVVENINRYIEGNKDICKGDPNTWNV